MSTPRLLTIAGHDPVHGAGITADLATWAAMGLDGASVVTALTVQNSLGLMHVQPVQGVREALRAVVSDGEPAAIKVGLLGSVAGAREVSEFLAARRCPVVVDPVLAGSNGVPSHDASTAHWREALAGVMRQADVITPNLPEAAWLLQVDVAEAAQHLPALRGLCRSAVVLKGGHASGPTSVDWVYEERPDGARGVRLSSPRAAGSAHGSGCVFSAVLAGMLAQGWDVFEAACEAKLRVGAGIAQARVAGPGRPHVQAAARLGSEWLPSLHWGFAAQSVDEETPAFLPPSAPLGFYAVLPNADWIVRALGFGVRTLQLRIKADAMPAAERRAQLRSAIAAARAVPGAQLFINDHWQDAIELGADGVHLGQEDLQHADLSALRSAGLRLGLSSHTPLEMSCAHAVSPSYVALGPVFPTTLKLMPYAPLGLARLRDWAARYRPAYPVVAIGGIGLAQAGEVLNCGVSSVAVVSALTAAADPCEAAAAFLRLMPPPN